ncbi:glycosyltransferase [Solilutibacter silvestris]|uniref:glycosyltransferase n=1 Tax=Solilutibacter silvestris TaxID=1645665 RepID=UPI003D338B17
MKTLCLGETAESNVYGTIGVCLVQAYAAPNYIRGLTLMAAARTIRTVELTQAFNTSGGVARYWQAIHKLLAIKKKSSPDAYILAFRGHEIAWLIRHLAKKQMFVFDAMMSPYSALTEERKFGWRGTLLAKLWRPIEHSALRNADAILTDTQSHSAYYQSEFGIPASKIIVIPVGAIEKPAVNYTPPHCDSPFRVLFYGSFLPLHGIDTIVSAAAKVTDLPVRFDFIGGNRRDALQLDKNLRKNGVRNFTHRRWVNFDRILDEEIPGCDLCLGGPFGGTPQARRVVTGKTHQAIALGKATVVGKITEDCGFIDKQNCLLVEQGNPEDLAEAIRWAYINRHELPALGMRAKDLHNQRYSSTAIGTRLGEALSKLQNDFAKVAAS